MNLFYDLLEDEFTKHNYPPDRVYNVDKSGLSIVQSKQLQIITRRGKKQVGALTSAERGSLVTVIFCMSAGGTFVPPLLIFPRKYMNEQLARGAPFGTVI